MKRSLIAGLLVFFLVQSKAIVAQVQVGSQAGINSSPDDIGGAIASIFNQSSGLEWELRVNQLSVPVEMIRSHRTPTVVLTLVNKANVPAKTVTAAKTEVEKIYRQAGVQVVWNSNEHSGPSNTIQLTVVIVRNCVNEQTC